MHRADVQNDAAVVQKHSAAQMDIGAIVDKYWRADRHILAQRTEELVENRRAGIAFSENRLVVATHQFLRPGAPRDEFGVARPVTLARQHLLALGHAAARIREGLVRKPASASSASRTPRSNRPS